MRKRKLLPESWGLFLRRRLIELLGLLWVFLAVGLSVALATYTVDDPSWNTYGAQGVHNALGVWGAYIADIFWQVFGFFGYTFPPFIMSLGIHTIRYHRYWSGAVRMGGFLLSLSIFVTAGGVLAFKGEPTVHVYPGGALGHAFSSYVFDSAPLWLRIVIALLLVCCGIFLYIYSLGISVKWRSFIPKRARKETYTQTAPKKKLSRTKKPHVVDIPTVATEKGYRIPSASLVYRKASKISAESERVLVEKNKALLESVLADFGVQGEVVNIRTGPVVTLYEFKPAAGIKSSRIIGLSGDIARSMRALAARISIIPGANALGIELPNQKRHVVYLYTLLESDVYKKTACRLPLILGQDIGGDSVITDLAKMPHLLIAGTTGSGKSVSVNTMILSLVFALSPEQCRFIMIDPKMLELSVYDGIPHLLTPVVTDPHKAVVALKWAVMEMEKRYQAMSQLGVRNIEGYNDKVQSLDEEQKAGFSTFPYIVVVVDELADLMLVAGKDIEAAVQRLAQMARAAGIHLIMATQRPSVDVITGTIKANFPTRISFQVTSKIDSRTILGEQGAEQLLGQGDMLYMSSGGKLTRVHGPFVDDGEIEKVVRSLREQGEPEYEESVVKESAVSFAGGDKVAEEGDELYQEALAIVKREQKASTSFIQRHLQIGYNRAARIIETMEAQGVISKANHVGKREVLINSD